MDKDARIYVAGGATLIGTALLAELRRQGFANLAGLPGAEPDLQDPHAVAAFFGQSRPQYVFCAAGDSGGIGRNQRQPADLMHDNLLVTANLIHAAHRGGVRGLLYLGSSCGYPRICRQPMQVEDLLTGPLEPTSEPYALAKLAGLTLTWAYRRQHGAPFIAAIPANAYGPGDDFRPAEAHVCAALIRRMHEAKEQGAAQVTIWGSGAARREFIYSADLAAACLFVMEHYRGDAPLNLGSGSDVSIAELAALIAQVVGFRGTLIFDSSKPDGMPRKLLDSRPLLDLGWQPRTSLQEGLVQTYAWFQEQEHNRRHPHA